MLCKSERPFLSLPEQKAALQSGTDLTPEMPLKNHVYEQRNQSFIISLTLKNMQEIFKIRGSVFLLCSSSFSSEVKEGRVKESTQPHKAKQRDGKWDLALCWGRSYIIVKKKHFNFGDCCAVSVLSYFKFSFGF